MSKKAWSSVELVFHRWTFHCRPFLKLKLFSDIYYNSWYVFKHFTTKLNKREIWCCNNSTFTISVHSLSHYNILTQYNRFVNINSDLSSKKHFSQDSIIKAWLKCSNYADIWTGNLIGQDTWASVILVLQISCPLEYNTIWISFTLIPFCITFEHTRPSQSWYI